MSIPNPRRRRYWSANDKVRILAEAMQEGSTFASVAKKYRLQSNQIHAWKRRMHPDVSNEGGSLRQAGDKELITNSGDPLVIDLRLTVTFKFEFV